MLWYKAWLDTRTRFLITLIAITALCARNVYASEKVWLSYVPIGQLFHGQHTLLCVLWVMSVTFLMMGGLLREKAAGVSSFTLALPVSRARLMCVRLGMGVLQSMALAIVPWVAMWLAGSIAGTRPALSQVIFHLSVLIGGGLVLLAIALLVSSLLEGEYTAPLVSFGILIGFLIGLSKKSIRPYDPLRLIAGADYWNIDEGLLLGPIPWLRIACHVIVAAILTAIAVRVIQRREF